MATAFINIGSNKGDRMANIDRAVALICRRFGSVRRSSVVRSAPWGYDSYSEFLNIGLAFEVGDTAPETLLDELLAMQHIICADSHRDNLGGYVDRVIDIDLIAVDEMVVATPRLTLPHPRMHLREFVLRPMAELAPDWRHPLLGMTAEELVNGLRAS